MRHYCFSSVHDVCRSSVSGTTGKRGAKTGHSTCKSQIRVLITTKAFFPPRAHKASKHVCELCARRCNDFSGLESHAASIHNRKLIWDHAAIAGFLDEIQATDVYCHRDRSLEGFSPYQHERLRHLKNIHRPNKSLGSLFHRAGHLHRHVNHEHAGVSGS